jgi:hypothetical protein
MIETTYKAYLASKQWRKRRHVAIEAAGGHCFGCGAHGGDALDLYAAMHKITLREAIAQLGGL